MNAPLVLNVSYKNEPLHVPDEVKSFLEDAAILGKINDETEWYITEDWAKRFQKHLDAMLPLAENGDPVAQYNVAVVYLCSYLYPTEGLCINSPGLNLVSHEV